MVGWKGDCHGGRGACTASGEPPIAVTLPAWDDAALEGVWELLRGTCLQAALPTWPVCTAYCHHCTDTTVLTPLYCSHRENWEAEIDIHEITSMPEQRPPLFRWRRVALLTACGVVASTALLRYSARR